MSATLVALVVAVLAATSPVTAATGWTGPMLVPPAQFCDDVAAAVDAGGRFHVVTNCAFGVRYSMSADSGRTWTTTRFSAPNNRFDSGPQIAIDGKVVYVAFSREIPATCGSDWDGVFFRQRTLPNGAWSSARRIGKVGDSLESFRAVGGTLHLTVLNGSDTFYETYRNGTYHQYALSDAVGVTSLRVGSDGKARIAYEAAHSLRYAVFSGGSFQKSTIPGTTARDRVPALVLDAANRAHIIWSHSVPEEGCGGGSTTPVDGTYYATNSGGTWTAPAARRFTTKLGLTSLTLDPATGRVYALVDSPDGVRFWTKSASGPWSSQKILGSEVGALTIRMDPSDGQLLVVYVRESTDTASSSVFALTRP